LQATKYFIIDEKVYSKDHLGVLLNFMVEEETEGIIDEFHKSNFGGHYAWKTTTYKILRVDYY